MILGPGILIDISANLLKSFNSKPNHNQTYTLLEHAYQQQ